MDNEIDALGQQVLAEIGRYAEPILQELLEEAGVSSLDDLSRADGKKLFIEAFRRAAPKAFPEADVDKLVRGLQSFTDEGFMGAHRKMREMEEPADAFEPAIGLAAAVVMAGVGLPVAPLDHRNNRILAPYSNDLAIVKQSFSDNPRCIVSYNSAVAEFYSLQTDCMKTLSAKIKFDKAAAPIRALIKRSRFSIPQKKDRFVHFAMLFPRRQGDRIPSVWMLDDSPDRGSILLSAGWVSDDGKVMGAPPDGRAMVPAGLARRVALDPQLAYWLTEPHDKPPITIH